MPTLSLSWLPKWLRFGDRKAEIIANRNQSKQALLDRIAIFRSKYPKPNNAPLTHLDLGEDNRAALEALTQNLEALTPYPAPLRQGTQLLDGTWVLLYSDAQEIARLANLPLGLRTGQICQVIDVANFSFENKADVNHRWGLLSGYVRVTAVFEPTPNQGRKVRERRIDVDFKTRFFAIQKLLGLPTPFFDPIRTVEIENPPEVVPSLEISYLDETLRIGRGGEGSLFILLKEEALDTLSTVDTTALVAREAKALAPAPEETTIAP
ncbi:PAP/fibrillin family protein [Prochlorothrix hollandica]